MATVILGSGIIGVSTAYYLSLHPSYNPKTSPIYLIEATSEPFQSASGYAGGFLAKDWFSPASAPLGELSFRLHEELANEYNGKHKWGYAKATALSMSIDDHGVSGEKLRGRTGCSRGRVGEKWRVEGASNAKANGNMLGDDWSPVWITPQEDGTLEAISSEDGCAQVEPWLLCKFLLDKCTKRGVKLLLGMKAEKVIKNNDDLVEKVKIEKTLRELAELQLELKCKNLLIAAGAWTPRVYGKLFPKSKLRIPIEPLAGYSIVVRSPRHRLVHDLAYGGAHSVFCAPGKNWDFAPEAISRTGREGQTEIYVAGLNSSTLPLPELATDIKENQQARQKLRKVTVQLSGALKEGTNMNEDDLEVVREGLCFRPVAPGGKPILCRLKEDSLGDDCSGIQHGGGIFIAAGTRSLGY